MPEINDRLNVEKRRPTLLFEELVRRLRAEIGHVVRVWSDAQDGPLRDDEPTPSMCPFARLVPTIANGTTRDNVSQSAVLQVNVLLAVEGFVDTDLFDVWGLFEDVVYPADVTSQKDYRLLNTGLGSIATDWKIVQPVTLADRGGGMVVGNARLEITYRIQG